MNDAEQEKQNGRRHPDLLIGGKQPYGDGRNAHDDKRQNQHGFPPDPVSEMSEEDAADGPCHEADGEGRVSEHRRNELVACRKKELIEYDARDDAIEKEIIPFYRRADDAREDDPFQVAA